MAHNLDPATMVINPTFNQTAGRSSALTQGKVPTTPMSSLTSNPTTRTVQGDATGLPQHLDPVARYSLHGSAPTIPSNDLAFALTTFSYGGSQMDMGAIARGWGAAPSQGSSFNFNPPLLRPNTGQMAPTLGQLAGAPATSLYTDPPQQPAINGPGSNNSHLISNVLPPVHTSTPSVTASGTGPYPAPKQPAPPPAGTPSLSTAVSTPIDSRGQRHCSHLSQEFGEGIPQMLGDMRDFIVSIAASVNGLKDAVSDLQAGQSTPGDFDPIPERKKRSRGRKVRRNKRGAARDPRSRCQNMEAHAGDNSIADDEDEGNDIEEQKKISQLRVGVVSCIPQLYS